MKLPLSAYCSIQRGYFVFLNMVFITECSMVNVNLMTCNDYFRKAQIYNESKECHAKLSCDLSIEIRTNYINLSRRILKMRVSKDLFFLMTYQSSKNEIRFYIAYLLSTELVRLNICVSNF